MAKALINGIRVHYQVKGTGPDLILIHGVTSSLAQWYIEMMPNLAKDYRVTVYDLRGHGLTDLTPNGYDSESMAGDLVALMDHLGIENARMVGHSYGGAIALHTAMLHPQRVKGIALLDTGLACMRHLRIIKNWVGWKMWGKELKHFGITKDWFMDLDSQQDATDIIRRGLDIPVQVGFRKGQSPMTPRIERLLNETKIGSEFREVGKLTEKNLTGIEVPVLGIYGGLSPYVGMAKRLSELLPRCRLEILPEAGHFHAATEPGVTVNLLRGFLEDPDAAVPARNASGQNGAHPMTRLLQATRNLLRSQ